jgi:hypothetical protein
MPKIDHNVEFQEERRFLSPKSPTLVIRTLAGFEVACLQIAHQVKAVKSSES